MSPLNPGSRLGRFELSTVLGQGSMGVVYLAHDPQIGRAVAIKTVRPEALRGEDASEIEERFQKEARLAGRLQHPNIVTIYDVGRDRDMCFIAMEFVDGRPLSRYLAATEDLPLSAKIAIIRQTADALAHAHERGVLHRDIKPGNILVAKDGRVKVTDFGIGRFTTAATSDLTRSGQMIGSPAYMSPEQVRGERLDGRSDLFSLGVVLYELLTGVRPFPGESITTLVYQILHTEPRDPRELKADLPADSREVLARLLAKQPENRPADAAAFIRELARIEKVQRESEGIRRAVIAAPERAAPTPSPALPIVEPLPVSLTSSPTVPGRAARKRGAIPMVLLAGVVLAIAAFLILRERRTAASTAAPIATAASTPVPLGTSRDETAPEASLPPEPVMTLPTPGPREAVDATVGAPRVGAPDRPHASPRPTAVPAAASVPAEPPAVREAAPSDSDAERADTVYSTRRSVRFTSSPDQARLIIDGRPVGIADDWDNRGGGRTFEFDRPGPHRVRMELPGYRSLHMRIEVSPDAEKDNISIDDELDRQERIGYEKLPSVYDRTTGPAVFRVEPPDAIVTEGGKTLGLASGFGPESPLQLRGPTVHDLILAAPGHRSRLVRILVSGNAGKDLAEIKEKLKAD